MKRLLTTLTLTLFILTTSVPLLGQTSSTLVPEDARFTVVTNPSKLLNSRLGETVLDLIRKEEPQVDEMINELSNTVGIDLRTSLGKTILFGTGYNQDSFALVADIGPTSGNINGLLLAAPGYDSDVYREKIIVHSLPAEGHQGAADRIFCAMPKRPGGESFYLVASFSPEKTRAMIDKTMDENARLTPADADADDNTLIEAWFTGLPELARMADQNGQGPPSAAVEMVQKAHLSLKDAGDSVVSEMTMTMVDDLRAQQVFELMRGGLAMMQLAATVEPEAQPLAEFGRMINIQHTPQDTDVTATFNCSYDSLDQLIERLEGMQ